MTSTHDMRARFIAAAGELTQTLGFGRNLGQIYGHLYLCPEPQSLDDLCRALAISKGSASMSVRQLEQWGAVKRVWIRGERRDYFEAGIEFGRIIRRALVELVGRVDESMTELLADSERWMKNGKRAARPDVPEIRFVAARVQHVRDFRKRARGLWNSPLIRPLLNK
jgi:DNA-binding transcriptional regulator GbsR (MarR family)